MRHPARAVGGIGLPPAVLLWVLGVLRFTQFSAEKVGAGGVGADPVAAQEEVMNLIREDQLLKLHMLAAERLCEFPGFVRMGHCGRRRHGSTARASATFALKRWART